MRLVHLRLPDKVMEQVMPLTGIEFRQAGLIESGRVLTGAVCAVIGRAEMLLYLLHDSLGKRNARRD